ncbi:MAG: ATP-binding protein [Candidatus Omnitrophota bacterium]
MQRFRFSFLTMSFIFSCAIIHGAPDPVILRYWTVEDGLGESFSTGISVGPSGKVYVNHGPVGVITILDGYRVTNIPMPNALVRLNEAPDGSIWTFATDEGYNAITGLYQYKNNRWTRYEQSGLNLSIHSEMHYISNMLFIYRFLTRQLLVPRRENRVVVLVPDRQMEFDAATGRSSIVLSATDMAIGSFSEIAAAGENAFWAAGTKGLIKFNLPDNDSAVSTNVEKFPFGNLINAQEIQSLTQTDDGAIYCVAAVKSSSQTAVLRFDGDWRIERVYSENPVLAGWRDSEQRLWSIRYANDHGSLFYEEMGEEHQIECGDWEWSGYFLSFALDKKDAFWIGQSNSLTRLAPPLWKQAQNLLGGDISIKGFFKDRQGRFWFGREKSLAFLDKEGIHEFSLEKALDDTIGSFYEVNAAQLSDNRIVFFNLKNPQKLFLFDPATGILREHHQTQRTFFYLYPNRDGTVWAVTGKENSSRYVETFDGERFQTQIEITDLPGIYYLIFEAANNDLWISSHDRMGLYRNGIWRLIDEKDGYTRKGAMSFLQLRDGRIWFGERAGAITEYDGKEFMIISSPASESIFSMVERKDGSIWVASGPNLHCYKDGIWVTHSSPEGLPEKRFTGLIEDQQEKLWAQTGDEDVYLYNPEADQDPPETKILNKERLTDVPLGENVQIAFTGMDKWKFTLKEHLMYSYRVDEEEWTQFSTKTLASLEGLTPGTHRFEVRAMDRNWNKDPIPATLDFSVVTPWYAQPMFIVIAISGSFVIVLLLGISILRHIQLRHAYVRVHDSEKELQASNEHLQNLNEQLHELGKMKSQFVSQASHDLRTPLTAIKSSLDNVMRGVGGGLNEKQHSVIERALRSVDRLNHLINDVLDLNRIETGRVVLDKTNIVLGTLVKSILNENAPAAQQKRIALLSHGLEDQQSIHVDVGKIERVVGELIGNAIKYTPEGGQVEVRLEKDKQHMILSVRDSGIGMTPEECAKIWERFYRTNASKKFAKGSGLGLSIAKELVELHGGSLEVESEEAKGTEFRLLLPIGGE